MVQAACDGFSDDLLHIGVIVSTSSISEWLVFNFRLAKGGNKDQLWLSLEKNKLYGGKRWCSPEKEAIRWL